jgi:hypothetical protein
MMQNLSLSQNLTLNPTPGRFQNQGYEYLSSIYRMKEEHDQLSSRGITPYVMPVKVLSVACLAIEEYLNVAGFRVAPRWEEFDHETEPIRGRIEYIYELLGKPVSFDKGIWKDVVELFEMEKRIKKDSLGLIKYYQQEISEIIKEAAQKYPILLSQAIAENAIELLLNHSSLGASLFQ